MKNKSSHSVLYFFLLALPLLSCQAREAIGYWEQLQIAAQYKRAVLLIDTGCSTCKNHLYDRALNEWPDSTALVIRRGISQETRLQYREILDLDFFYHDSLDKSFETGLTEKNTELALISYGKTLHYNFLQYKELIKELRKN